MEWELELVGFDKQLNWATARAAQLIDRAEVLKNQGNVVFKKVLTARWSHSISCSFVDVEFGAPGCASIRFIKIYHLLQGDYKRARTKWQKALKLLGRHCQPESEEEEASLVKVKLGCLLNLALVSQREQSFGEALQWCTKALQ